MRRIKLATLTLFVLAAIIVTTLFIIGKLKPKVAGIYIETTPSATVFMNGEQVGRTSFKETFEPGEVVVKLIPESFEKPLAPYETRINLVEGVETVIRYDFGESEGLSSGEIVSFEKIDKDQTSLVVISIPDSAHLVIDGFQKSATPFKTSSITAGDHNLFLTSEGFIDRQIKVKTHKGYKLTAIVQLALSTEQFEERPLKTETPEEPQEKVEILSTPVGFLRVRAEPSTLGKEVGQVEPGETYPLIDEDEVSGWYKINFSSIDETEEATSSAKVGWISNQYAKKVTGSVTPTVSVE